MANFEKLIKDLGFIAKIIELILCLVAIILMVEASSLKLSIDRLGAIASGGGTILVIALIIVYILEEDCNKAEVIFLFIYGILLIVDGILFASRYSDNQWRDNNVLIVTILELVAGVIFIIDFVRALKK